MPTHSHDDIMTLSNSSPQNYPKTSLPSMELQQIPNVGQVEALENPTDAVIEYPTGFRFAIVIVATLLALVLVGLDNTIIATAVPSITDEFKTIADIGWYSAAYRLTACSFQFMFGKIYTVFSVKVVFLCALVIFEIGSVVSGAAATSYALVIGRAVAGLGCAGIIAGVLTMYAQSVPVRKRPILLAVGAAMEELSSAIAPLLGGIITDKASWRWCFYINLPLGGITFLIVLFFYTDILLSTHYSLPLKQKLSKIDPIGTAIMFPGITSLLLALQFGGSTYGWGDARIIALLLLFVTLIGAFGWYQWRRGDEATLPPRIILHRSIISGMWFALCNNSALAIIEYYMPIYLQAVRQVSPIHSGILVLPSSGGLLVSLLFSGSAVAAVGYYTPFMLVTSILAPVAAGLLTTLKVDATLASLICYQGLLGFGAGIGFQGPSVAAQTILSPQDIPIGVAAIQFALNLGPAVFVPVAQSIFTKRLGADLTQVAPGLNQTSLQSMGISDLRDYVGAGNLEGTLEGYDKAVTQTYYLAVALTCATLAGSAAMEWRSVKQKMS